MENKELSQFKPIYIRDPQYAQGADAIDLIDLTIILVKRRLTLLLVFSIVMAIGLVKILITPTIYEFSTSLEVGNQLTEGKTNPLETTQTLEAKMRFSFIPQVLNEFKTANPDTQKTFDIDVKAPKNSQIVVLSAQGTLAQKETLTTLLNEICEKAITDHERVYQSVKQHLQLLIKNSNIELAAMENSLESQSNKNFLKNDIENYKNQITNLRPTRQILPPMRSVNSVGLKQKYIFAGYTAAGLILGILSAFFVEFVARVREKNSPNE